jgi:hypothetical protein
VKLFALPLVCGKEVSDASRSFEMLKKSQGQIEDTTPIESQHCTAVTLVRPLEKYPRDFETHAAKAKQSRIQALTTERTLLNKFLGVSTQLITRFL